jgi:hypothetical protein
MEADVEGLIGAGRHEGSGERSTWRNGYRDRTLDTRLGSLQLRIPKLRQGAISPFLDVGTWKLVHATAGPRHLHGGWADDVGGV